MKKKMWIILFSLIFLLASQTFAEPEDTAPTPEPPAEQTEVPPEPEAPDQTPDASVNQAEQCICGRPIYAENGQGYSKYDCTKCRQNYLLCQCDCWCGAETYRQGEGEGLPKYCAGCNNLCPDCTCADKETLLRRETQVAEGSLSPLGLQKPASAAAISAVMVLITAALFFAVSANASTPPLEIKPKKEKAKIPPPKKATPEQKKDGRLSPIPVNIQNLSPLQAYDAAEEWINRSVRKRADLLNDLGAQPLSAGQFAGLKTLSGIQPNEKCPVNTDAAQKPLPAAFCNKDGLTEEGKRTAAAILTPDRICKASKRGEPGYTVCLKGETAMILSDEGRLTGILTKKQIASFLRKGLCDFSEHEEKIERQFSETFSPNTFTLFLTLFVTGKTRFDKEAITKITQQIGLPPEKVEKHLMKLEEKQLLHSENGIRRFTLKAKTILPEPGDDAVFFQTEEQNVLFVNKTDCTLCFHEKDGGYFLISCEKIPWNLYLGD